jgi:hypothetical protein
MPNRRPPSYWVPEKGLWRIQLYYSVALRMANTGFTGQREPFQEPVTAHKRSGLMELLPGITVRIALRRGEHVKDEPSSGINTCCYH